MAARELVGLAVTVEPEEYRTLEGALAGGPARPALGLHPWYVSADPARRASQLEAFRALAATTHLVGEVGLDLGRAHGDTAEAQVQAFREVLSACRPGSVLSIHAVASASMVLDLLEERGRDLTAILHWFSGSADELVRARSLGCRFSVGQRMLASRRGREYARQLPLDALLLETDLPAAPGQDPRSLAETMGESLGRTCETIASLRSLDPCEVRARTAQNGLALLAR